MIELNGHVSVRTISESDGATKTTNDEPAETPDLMPGVAELSFSGDPGAMLAALTMQAAKSQREVSRSQRQNAEKMQEQDEAKEIQDLRDKADLVRIQGFVDGVSQIASAAANFGAGMADAHAAGDNANAEAKQNELKAHQDANDWSPDQIKAQQAQITGLHQDAASCGSTATSDRAGGEALGGVEKMVDGLFQGAITDKDTDAKLHDMAAQSAKRMVEDARDDEKDAKELMAKALEFYKDYTAAKDQTTLAATHRA